MVDEVIISNPSSTSRRYSITQELIDEILTNELKNFVFPVKPIYNSRIKDNGRTIAEMYKWGQLKQIKCIEIGKQDKTDRAFLIDTLLHEYYEAYILEKQFGDDFFRSLSRAEIKRHSWIDDQIKKFFDSLEDRP